ncbi:MAG: RNA-binding protein [Alphaproteobacteria bacterium]
MQLEQEADTKAPPPDDVRKGVRRCIVTRQSLPRERLVRFVIAPDGTVAPDVAGKLPGRGLWLTARRDIVRRACAGNLFAKAARAPVTVQGDLAQQVEHLIARRCLDLVGLARRAGDAVAGFEKVRALLSRGRAGVLLTAADGAAGGRRKLGGVQSGVRRIDVLTSEELGRMFGREAAVHVALRTGNLADRLIVEADRLTGFRTRDELGKLC